MEGILFSPILLGPSTVFSEIKRDFLGQNREICMVIGRDHKKKMLFKEVIGYGEDSKVQCEMKDFFSPVLRHHAKELIVVHNHPEGLLSPSKDDLISTKALVEAADLLGLLLVDHLIVHEENYISMYRLGHIPQRETY